MKSAWNHPQVNEVDSIGQTALFYAITHCQARIWCSGNMSSNNGIMRWKWYHTLPGKDIIWWQYLALVMISPIAVCQTRIIMQCLGRQQYHAKMKCNGNVFTHCQARLSSDDNTTQHYHVLAMITHIARLGFLSDDNSRQQYFALVMISHIARQGFYLMTIPGHNILHW